MLKLSIAVSIFCLTAQAAFADAAQDCLQVEDPQVEITGCSEVLDQPQITSKQRSLVYTLRGSAYRHQSKLDLAQADYDNAVAQDPDNARAYIGRGELNELWATLIAGQPTYEKAAADFDRALMIMGDNNDAPPDSSGQIVTATAALRDHRDCDQANDVGRRIQGCGNLIDGVEGTPNAAIAFAYANRAGAYEDQHNYDVALTDLNQAIALNPKYANALVDRGYLYRFQNNYSMATKDFLQAAALIDKLNAANTDPDLTKFAKELRDRATGSNDEEMLDQRWVEYLKEIEANNEYQNWSDKPYSALYVKGHRYIPD